MPGLNGSGFSNSYNSSLGEEESAILNAEIPLYEVKPTTLQYFADKIMGMWAVKVNYRPTANNKISTSIDWYNQKGAYVTINVFGKGGKRFGYIPDDPLWHNRLLMLPITLGNTPSYEVLRYHTMQGFTGGARALKELVMLRDLTKEWIVWNRDKKREVFRSFDGTECDEFIAKKVRYDQDNDIQVMGGAEIILKKAAVYKESKHLELRAVMVPRIQKIVDRAGDNWMVDDEWKKDVLPDIKNQINARFGEADIKERRAEALRYLPEIQSQLDAANNQIEQLKPLVELMKDPAFANMIKQFAPGVVAAAEKIAAPVVISSEIPTNGANRADGTDSEIPTNGANRADGTDKVIEAPAPHTEVGETDLKDLNVTALRQIAKNNFGIKGVEKKSQEALLAEIREKQGIADEESSNEADSISVDD